MIATSQDELAPHRVEVYGDVLCPWCYIAKRRIEAALDGLAGRERVALIWRSYELGQESRLPGPTAAEELRKMWGDRAAARLTHIQELGLAEGLELNLHFARPVNTFDAHRLGHLGAARGLGDGVLERLLRAYHTEALNIADRQVLERLGSEAGLKATEARALLTGDAYATEVRADKRRATQQGVRSVPAVVIDGRAPVPGVQAPAALRRLLQEALERSSRFAVSAVADGQR